MFIAYILKINGIKWFDLILLKNEREKNVIHLKKNKWFLRVIQFSFEWIVQLYIEIL